MLWYIHETNKREEKNLDETSTKWVDDLFYAFKQDIAEPPLDLRNVARSGDTHAVSIRPTPDQVRGKATNFFNKRANLTKTTRSIEDQVVDLTSGLRDMQAQQKALRSELRSCQQQQLEQLTKMNELLRNFSRT